MPRRYSHGVQTEASVHEQACAYLKLRYPQAIFVTDFAAGIKLTMGQAVKRKKLNSSRALPDLVILHPVGVYHGLCLELKKDGTVIYKQDGTLRANPHHEEQAAVIEELNLLGYKADFAVGFDEARTKIDDYFAGNI